MFKVFISYSTRDLINVTELQQSLLNAGVKVFIAENSVKASESLSERISSEISACDLFVLLWSSNAKASDWVSQEIGKAHSLKKTILPLVLEQGLTLPGFISDLKYLPVFQDPSAAMEKARDIVLEKYQQKQQHLHTISQKQKEETTRNVLVLGGVLLWLFNQK